MKRTPFYHVAFAMGARMRQAQGWELIDEFTDNRSEHVATRTAAGLFDWSSMGEIEVRGPSALALLQHVLVNDASHMEIGRVLYSSMCRPDGSMFSDVTVYRQETDRYLVIPAWSSNAANQRPNYDWLVDQGRGMNVTVSDFSSALALLSLQGPCSRDILAQLTAANLAHLPYMYFADSTLGNVPNALISRSGWTGELGYELIFPVEYADEGWEQILNTGRPYGLVPCGLKTSMSLRIEKGYLASGDVVDGMTPLEAGLEWTVKFGKPDFVGKEALLRQKQSGIRRKLSLIALEDGFLPPPGAAVFQEWRNVGKVTSSAFGHTINSALAMTLIASDVSLEGTRLSVEANNTRHPAEVVRRPLLDPAGERLRS